jgi:hypothetical protein
LLIHSYFKNSSKAYHDYQKHCEQLSNFDFNSAQLLADSNFYQMHGRLGANVTMLKEKIIELLASAKNQTMLYSDVRRVLVFLLDKGI